MRTRALGALIAAFVLHGASPVAAQAPQRNYLGRLYRSAIERETLVGHDARRLGMGSAGAAAGVSPDAVVWNPAALGAVSQMTVGVMDSGSADTSATRAGAASGAVPLVDLAADARGAVGASAWIGDWGPDAEKQRSFLAGYGTPFGPVSVGGALRHERHYFGADTLSAWTADLGMQAAGVPPRGPAWRAGRGAARRADWGRPRRLPLERRFTRLSWTWPGWWARPSSPSKPGESERQPGFGRVTSLPVRVPCRLPPPRIWRACWPAPNRGVT